jgi:hypothetical protein
MVLEVPVGPQGRLVPGTNVDFFKDVVKVGFDGVRTQAQRCGNGPVGGAFHDLGQDVGFAGGKGVGGGLGKVAAAPGQQFDHRLARDPQLAVENGLDPFGQVLKGGVAVKIAPDAFRKQLRFKAGKGVEVEQADPARAGILGSPGGGRPPGSRRPLHPCRRTAKEAAGRDAPAARPPAGRRRRGQNSGSRSLFPEKRP